MSPHRLSLALCPLVVMLSGVSVRADGVQVTLSKGGITDRRSNDTVFGSQLTVGLLVKGEQLKKAYSLRPIAKTALDNHGKNILERRKSELEVQFQSTGWVTDRKKLTETETVWLALDNPTRAATQLKQLSGEVELYIPSRDALSSVTIKDFRLQQGKWIASPALKASGIEVMFLTKGAGTAATKARFIGLANLHDAGIAFYVKDPQSRLINIAFDDGKGNRIEERSRAHGGQTDIYNFDKKLPDTTRITIHISTPKSLVKVPFQFTNVALP